MLASGAKGPWAMNMKRRKTSNNETLAQCIPSLHFYNVGIKYDTFPIIDRNERRCTGFRTQSTVLPVVGITYQDPETLGTDSIFLFWKAGAALQGREEIVPFFPFSSLSLCWIRQYKIRQLITNQGASQGVRDLWPLHINFVTWALSKMGEQHTRTKTQRGVNI